MKKTLALAPMLAALPAFAHDGNHPSSFAAGLALGCMISGAVLLFKGRNGLQRAAGAVIGGAGLCLLAGVA